MTKSTFNKLKLGDRVKFYLPEDEYDYTEDRVNGIVVGVYDHTEDRVNGIVVGVEDHIDINNIRYRVVHVKQHYSDFYSHYYTVDKCGTLTTRR